MATNAVSVSPFLSYSSRRRVTDYNYRKRSASSTKVFASRRSSSSEDYDHHQSYRSFRLVDENMIVLRKRIHEMKMVERNYEPPSDWNDWEKRYYTSYDSFICQALGLLQSHLMNTRPSLALGIMGLLLLSLPMSTTMLLFHLLDFSKEVFAGAVHMVMS